MISERGETFIFGIIVMAVVLVTTLIMIGGSSLYFQNATYTLLGEEAIALAEAGIDKAITAINKTGGGYSGELETFLGDGSYSTKVTDKDAGTKIIESSGYIPNKLKPKVKRTLRIEASKGIGVSFVYGIQVGEGGLELGNNNLVKGSVYSNGNITAGNSNEITGDGWVAGGPQPTPDQQTTCINCDDFVFGKSINGENRLDLAQSFKPSTSGLLNKVSVRVKKFGSPTNVNVRILKDSSGSPDKNGVLALGTLYASLVTGSYGWIDVTFTTSPNLTAETIYWLMIDTSSDSSNFWSWENDLAVSYTRGQPKWSPNWSIGNPTWNIFSGDLSFKTYMGGAPTSIRAQNNLLVRGNVHANTIDGLNINGDAYYQTIVNSTVAGSSNPGSADPPPKVFPISEANIAEWKDIADGDGTNVQTGDISNCVTTLSSKKYAGNITFDSNCTITVETPIWITGNLTLGSNIQLKLDSKYGTTSGVVVIDGNVSLNTNNKLLGTGQGSSLLMALSTYDSRSNSIAAIIIGNNGNTGVFYASSGIIEPGSNNIYKELTAWGIRLVNSSTIDYETGLSSSLFSSGPTGAYSLVKGTYQVK